jgi:hypothetical protein
MISVRPTGSYAPGRGTIGGSPMRFRAGLTRSTHTWQIGCRTPSTLMDGTEFGL